MRKNQLVRKRAFTLIEVLISASLAVILLSTGIVLIHSFFRTRTDATRHFETALHKHMRNARLRHCLSSMVSFKDRKPLLSQQQCSIKEKKLLFTMDNGICNKAQLANTVLALLFLDQDGLQMALRADPKRKDMKQTREEVYLLWPKVKNFSCQFLGKKNPSEQTLEWCDEWQEETLPLAIRITLSFEDSQKEEVLTAVIHESIAKRPPLSLEITKEQLAEYASKAQEGEE